MTPLTVTPERFWWGLGAVLLLLLALLYCCSCSSAQRPAEPQPWQEARTSIASVQEALGALGALVPPEALAAERAARCGEVADCPDALALTQQTLSACLLAVDALGEVAERGWRDWVGLALRAVAVVLGLVKGAGVELPGGLQEALAGASGLLGA